MNDVLIHVNDMLTRGAESTLDQVFDDKYKQKLYPVVKLITQYATEGIDWNLHFIFTVFVYMYEVVFSIFMRASTRHNLELTFRRSAALGWFRLSKPSSKCSSWSNSSSPDARFRVLDPSPIMRLLLNAWVSLCYMWRCTTPFLTEWVPAPHERAPICPGP